MAGGSSQQAYDVIVLGAGAAGLLCAAEIGRRGRRVLLLDAAERAGKKILISGGGRCNFTNLHTTPANYLSQNPHFAKSALARYTPADFVALVEQHHIPYHEKTLGQLFCDGSAQAIVTMLEEECRVGEVELRLRTPVLGLTRLGGGFTVHTAVGDQRAARIVVATGGLSIPKMGATGIGYEIARSFGLHIVEPRPALVPLTFDAEDVTRWADLSGLSAEVVASTAPRQGERTPPTAFREKLLITHRGLSGPAVLQVSSYWAAGKSVQIDLAPGVEVFSGLQAAGSARDRSVALQDLRRNLPARLAERWIDLQRLPDWRNASVALLEQRVHRWHLTPGGTEGYAKAEVTAGGVSTAELNSSSLEAKRIPNLYFIGEVVDVTGHLGGYNFQWAWASAVACARAICGG